MARQRIDDWTDPFRKPRSPRPAPPVGNPFLRPDAPGPYRRKGTDSKGLKGRIPGVPIDMGPLWDGRGSGGSGIDPAAAAAAAAAEAAAEAAAKAAARAQSEKENAATQDIINTLLSMREGYLTGRDKQLENADAIFAEALTGIGSQYDQTIADLGHAQRRNEEDEGAKTGAIRSNRAREQTSIQEQLIAQGAGETDALRSMVQAFENADANQLEVTTSYADTLNSVDSNVRQTNAATENARRNAWGQKEDSRAQAYEDYYKNYTQLMTDVQRTAAGNTNVDSDYSVAFNPDFQGLNILDEVKRYAGEVYDWEAPDATWAGAWAGQKKNIGGKKTTATSLAGLTTLGGLKRAEGVDLREW